MRPAVVLVAAAHPVTPTKLGGSRHALDMWKNAVHVVAFSTAMR